MGGQEPNPALGQSKSPLCDLGGVFSAAGFRNFGLVEKRPKMASCTGLVLERAEGRATGDKATGLPRELFWEVTGVKSSRFGLPWASQRKLRGQTSP